MSRFPGSGAFFPQASLTVWPPCCLQGRPDAHPTPTLRPDVPIRVNRRIVSRRSSLMPGDHSSWQGSDTINALPCGALIPNGADGWRHCFERAKNGQIGGRSPNPNTLVASFIVISIKRRQLVFWLQYHNHPHMLPVISNRFMVRFWLMKLRYDR